MFIKHFKILLMLIFLITACEENTTVVDYSDEEVVPEIENEIQEIVNKVNIDSVKTTLEILTGVNPFINNGDTLIIKTRHSNFKENDYAADYLEYRLESYGYSVINQNFNDKGRNVYAVLDGNENKDEYFIICAHYDSMPESIISPGADDNGSGTALVVEAARVFAELNPKTSIIFAFWDEEEQGLIGSKYFAEQAKNENIKIKGVVNIDMVGWDSNNDYYLMLAVENIGLDYEIIESAKDINMGMNLGLTIGITQSTNAASDHLSFLSRGYEAYCFIEDKRDFNGFYHSTNDKLQFINMEYYSKNCKVIIGTFASLVL